MAAVDLTTSTAVSTCGARETSFKTRHSEKACKAEASSVSYSLQRLKMHTLVTIMSGWLINRGEEKTKSTC